MASGTINKVLIENNIKYATFNSSTTASIKVGDYGSVLLMGLLQGYGAVVVAVTKTLSTITAKSLISFSDWNSSRMSITTDGDYINITSDIVNTTQLLAIVK